MLSKVPGFSLVGFEIQQDIKYYGDKLRERFPETKIDIIYSAVATEDGELEYYEPKTWGKNYKGGTTIQKEKSLLNDNYNQAKITPAINFSNWLEKNVDGSTFVFLKMDIEGAEYDVIEHLIDEGTIKLLNVVAVEWHAKKFPEPLRSKYESIEKRLKEYASTNNLTVLDWY
jgi:FkbM family methyltransferase